MNLDLIQLERVSHSDLEIIVEWHEEHVKINFPGSLYLPSLFRKIIYPAFDNPGDNLMNKIVVDGTMAAFYWIETKQDLYKSHGLYHELRYFHIDKPYRKQGLGSKMMEFVDKDVISSGGKELRLGTSACNEAAVSLYKKSGFKITRLIMEKKYGD
jgi:ribosomal protein S18 acetylase RimI-like enzyme